MQRHKYCTVYGFSPLCPYGELCMELLPLTNILAPLKQCINYAFTKSLETVLNMISAAVYPS